MLGEISGIPPQIKYAEKQKGDMRHTYASTEQAHKDLAYSPSVTLRRGLTEEFKWLKDLYDRGLTHRVD